MTSINPQGSEDNKNGHKYELFWNAITIFTLVNLVIAQPLYSLVGENPEFFVAHQAERKDPIWIAVIISLLLPLFIVTAQYIINFVSARLYKLTQFIVISLLIFLMAVQILNPLDLNLNLLASASLLIGGIFSHLLTRSSLFETFIRMTSISVIIVPLAFIFLSPTKYFIFKEAITFKNEPITNEIPIVFLVLDELPLKSLLDANGNLDKVRFPNFSRLAETSTWYKNATADWVKTLESIPSILSGKVPGKNSVATTQDFPLNLFTVLGPSYELFVYEPYTQLCPKELCISKTDYDNRQRLSKLLSDLYIVYLHIQLPNALTQDLPSISDDWKNFDNFIPTSKKVVSLSDKKSVNANLRGKLGELELEDFTSTFEKNISTIGTSMKASLHFQHILLPHTPWRYLPNGQQYFNSANIGRFKEKGAKWAHNLSTITSEYHRHLLQLGYVDLLLGKLINKLENTRTFNDSMIIITSDHGASFRPGVNRRTLSEKNKVDVGSIPLFIKYPNQKDGNISKLLAKTADILPTIIDVTGGIVRSNISGTSLLNSSVSSRKSVNILDLPRSLNVTHAELETFHISTSLNPFSNTNNEDLIESWYGYTTIKNLIGEPKPADTTIISLIHVSVDNISAFNSVNLNSEFIPARLTGTVKGIDENSQFAVALNGRIVSMFNTYNDRSTFQRFSTMLAPSYFKQGENVLDFYLLSENESSDIQLTNVYSKNDTVYSLVELNGKRILRNSKQQIIEIRPNLVTGPLRGHVEKIIKGSQANHIRGWAIDIRSNPKILDVVVFKSGEFLSSTKFTKSRPDVARKFKNSELEFSGFSITIPNETLSIDGAGKVTIMAVSPDGIATELIYPRDFPWKD